jgi:hypothetical protein
MDNDTRDMFLTWCNSWSQYLTSHYATQLNAYGFLGMFGSHDHLKQRQKFAQFIDYEEESCLIN